MSFSDEQKHATSTERRPLGERRLIDGDLIMSKVNSYEKNFEIRTNLYEI